MQRAWITNVNFFSKGQNSCVSDLLTTFPIDHMLEVFYALIWKEIFLVFSMQNKRLNEEIDAINVLFLTMANEFYICPLIMLKQANFIFETCESQTERIMWKEEKRREYHIFHMKVWKYLKSETKNQGWSWEIYCIQE